MVGFFFNQCHAMLMPNETVIENEFMLQ